MPRVDMHTHMDAKTQYAKSVEAMDTRVKAEVGHRHMRMGREAVPNAGSAYEREEVYTPMSLRMSDLRLWISESADHV